MEIARVQIEGGFLDGFDLTFSPGLNVIIGARGTGKTSVIELIRYGLGARNHTTESRNRSLDHARAVLDGGEVSITLTDLTREALVTRSADDDEPRAAESFLAPIVLSQTEIETLGLSESGRLSLLDGFIGRRSKISTTEAASVASINSVYKEIGTLEAEVNGLQEALKAQSSVQAKIKESEEQLAKLQGDSTAIAEKQAKLNVLSNQISDLVVKHDVLSHFEEGVRNWASSLDQMISTDFGPDPWSGDTSTDPLTDLRRVYEQTLDQVTKAVESFKGLEKQTRARREYFHVQRVDLDKEARSLRVELEKLAEGTGALARQLATQRALLAQLQSRAMLLKERNIRLEKLRELRNEHFETLLNIRGERFALRSEAAARISSALAPYIRVEVEPYHRFVRG